ncbi:hypothetical protein [Streptomyces gibsoniae]|uniref:Uncharacterized protein n=1 Tax=Streptomyces gibsoniae TaxID=3075529 RepID=A0ABU2U8W7_9ACTN|nr:hypothetical protein [Streptomyces sp. DSM 41699]MDT0469684.1 hypothetical protein [Streptomyces sp. DSM 41699]
MTHRTAPPGAMGLLQTERNRLSAQLAADDHGKTKEPLPQRPRGPHPYRVARHYASARVRRELLADYQDGSSAVARLASWIGAAA